MQRLRRAVQNWHVVKFCPPSECTLNRAIAVVDYALICGHVLRARHFGPGAVRAKLGQRVHPMEGWVCPVCSRLADEQIRCERRLKC